jgi:predicted nucleotidyltransferase
VYTGNDMIREIESKLATIKTTILKNIPTVEKIYLFGSYAYGKPHKNSDFDLFIVIPNNDLDTIELEVSIRDEVFSYNIFNYDMLFETTAAFERRRQSFALENKVFTEGVLLYERI